MNILKELNLVINIKAMLAIIGIGEVIIFFYGSDLFHWLIANLI
jgi:hypothetical protein